MRGWASSAALLVAAARVGQGYDLDTASTASIKSIAGDMATDMMSFYNGDQPGNTPGLLPQPYYWWEAGALMGTLVDYWYYTGDDRWNDVATQGLLFQVGPNKDYMPPNQTLTEGNDDQVFWGLAAMSAAEYKFPNPPADQPQWLALAQAVFNTQAARWDTSTCAGGLRWQIFTWNNGYDYKNSISEAGFFLLGARLALYTGNASYADWASRAWDWTRAVGFMDSSYYIYDGAHVENNCTQITPYQFSYNAGGFLLGAAAMYNQTTGATQAMWRERVEGMLNGTAVFFTGNKSDVMTEVACEPVNLCDLDQQSFKAHLARWMAATTKWAAFTYPRILPLLQTSARAAAAQCTGGSNGRMCGLRWTDAGKWDGSTGVGQQMAAMEVVLGNMIQQSSAPLTNATGGNSTGDAGAGGPDVGRTDGWTALELMAPITAADRAGAALLTLLTVLCCVAGVAVMLDDETSHATLAQRWAAAVATAGAAAGAAGKLRKSREKVRGEAVVEKKAGSRRRRPGSGSSGSSGSSVSSGSSSPRADLQAAAERGEAGMRGGGRDGRAGRASVDHGDASTRRASSAERQAATAAAYARSRAHRASRSESSDPGAHVNPAASSPAAAVPAQARRSASSDRGSRRASGGAAGTGRARSARGVRRSAEISAHPLRRSVEMPPSNPADTHASSHARSLSLGTPGSTPARHKPVPQPRKPLPALPRGHFSP